MTRDIYTFDVFVRCFALEVFIYCSSEEKQKGHVSYKRRNVGKNEDTKTTHFDISNAERCN